VQRSVEIVATIQHHLIAHHLPHFPDFPSAAAVALLLVGRN